MTDDKNIQEVIVTFDDGEIAIFSGRAVCGIDDPRRITDIKFTKPRELPIGYKFEPIDV